MPDTLIRSFENADLPAIHRLWLEHWSFIGPPPQVGVAQIEQAILARSFFRADHFLLACNPSGTVSWLEFIQHPEHPDLAVIPAICAGIDAQPQDLLALLLEAKDRCVEQGIARIEVGVVRDALFGFAGLDPIGPGCGVSHGDARLHGPLNQCGFSSGRRATTLAVSVAGFRPPVNREALAYRRAGTRIETSTYRQASPRAAAGMSHLDVETHQLVNRDGSQLAQLQGWYSDPEAEVMRPSRMILDLGSAHQAGAMESSESYLLGSIIQMASQRNIVTAETSIDDSASVLREQLEKLQFRVEAEGTCWNASL